MSKIKTRLIVVTTAIVTIISTICYAQSDVQNTKDNQAEAVKIAAAGDYARTVEDPTTGNSTTEVTDSTNSDEIDPISNIDTENETPISEGEVPISEDETPISEEVPSEEDIVSGDLYIFDSDIVMDKLVDGNVFLFGNNITITGQTSGNMFIIGNNITFDKAYAQASVFLIGNEVTFNAVSNNLYAIANSLKIDSQFGVYSDIYTTCKTLDFNGIIGRNAYLNIKELNLNEEAIFYGDLNYISNNEFNIPEGVVTGKINKTNSFTIDSETTSIINTLFSVLNFMFNLIHILVLVAIVYLITKLFTKSSPTKEDFALSNPLKTFGTGIAGAIIIPVVLIILMITILGLSTGLLGLAIYLLLMAVAKPIFIVSFVRFLFKNTKNHKSIKEFLVSLLVAVVIWALTSIPVLGIIIDIIIFVLGLGIILYTPLMKKKQNSTTSQSTENKESKNNDAKE